MHHRVDVKDFVLPVKFPKTCCKVNSKRTGVKRRENGHSITADRLCAGRLRGHRTDLLDGAPQRVAGGKASEEEVTTGADEAVQELLGEIPSAICAS